jgi:carboxyl-terminal processing protease
MNETQNSPKSIALPLVLCLGLAGGIFIGMNLKGGGISTVQSGKEYEKLKEVFGLIENEYVDGDKSKELVEETIEHILAKLDPHSAYIPVSDRIAANEDLQGNYEGIGIEFNIFHDTLVVVTPLSGGPSEAVGLKAGDKIIKVDDKIIAGIGIKNNDVFKLLKGRKGTEVKIEAIRGNRSPMEFTIIRDKIPQFSLDVSYMITPEIGYIKVNRFSSTTFEEFKEALSKLKESGMKKLVLDLQGNPGGYMNEATEMADEFLSDGKKIVYTDGQDTRFNTNSIATSTGDFETGDLIVLINEGSASASEILAGALQDNDRAMIVGRRSFGKGLVQRPFDLSDGSELRLTISRYYTPSGRSIQKPYGEGENYSREIAMRYNKGEFFTADSIQFNDSLKYKTSNGRSVYGGGGIMPDYFVPLDTTLASSYLNSLYISNSIQEYTFDYSEKNREALEKMGGDEFIQKFVVTDEMLNALVQTGIQNKVKADYKDLAKNKFAFQTHVKALIARKIWKNGGYYQVMNETNEILQEALKLFDRIPELNRTKM